MPQSKKFIITKDKSMSDTLIAHGFLLLSNKCGTYTFVNEQKENFNFSSIDHTKIYFTDKLFI